jgi:ribosome-associated protein
MAKRTINPARRLAIAMARVCAENRCREVAVLDLRGLSPVTDFFVLATGTSARQMHSAANRAVEAGREIGQRPFGVEGIRAAGDRTLDQIGSRCAHPGREPAWPARV